MFVQKTSNKAEVKLRTINTKKGGRPLENKMGSFPFGAYYSKYGIIKVVSVEEKHHRYEEGWKTLGE